MTPTIVSLAATLFALAAAGLAVRFARLAKRYRLQTEGNVSELRRLQLEPAVMVEMMDGIRERMTAGFVELGYAPAAARHLAEVAFESWLDYVREDTNHA